MTRPILRPAREEVIAVLTQLVAIDSVNPSLVPGAAGEGAIAEYVATWLEDAGLAVETHEVAPGRPNVRELERSPSVLQTEVR